MCALSQKGSRKKDVGNFLRIKEKQSQLGCRALRAAQSARWLPTSAGSADALEPPALSSITYCAPHSNAKLGAGLVRFFSPPRAAAASCSPQAALVSTRRLWPFPFDLVRCSILVSRDARSFATRRRTPRQGCDGAVLRNSSSSGSNPITTARPKSMIETSRATLGKRRQQRVWCLRGRTCSSCRRRAAAAAAAPPRDRRATQPTRIQLLPAAIRETYGPPFLRR